MQNHSPTQKYKESFNFFQRRRFSAQSKVLPPYRILGQKAHFPGQSAPTVPDFGTEGSFSPPKCSHRPVFWDRRRIFPAKVLPPSRILGQKARFPRQSAPSVPYFGTEGAFSPPECSHRPVFWDRRRISGTEGVISSAICVD